MVRLRQRSVRSLLTIFFFVGSICIGGSYIEAVSSYISQDPERLDLKKYEITTPPESEFERPGFNIETYPQYGQIKEVVDYYRRRSVDLEHSRESFWRNANSRALLITRLRWPPIVVSSFG